MPREMKCFFSDELIFYFFYIFVFSVDLPPFRSISTSNGEVTTRSMFVIHRNISRTVVWKIKPQTLQLFFAWKKITIVDEIVLSQSVITQRKGNAFKDEFFLSRFTSSNHLFNLLVTTS
jgi:hypothetical protein